MRTMLYISGISHSVALILAAYSHTLGLLTSKLRSSLEAGKKQLRVWLQYVCGVTETLLYPSFRVPLVLLWSHYGDSKMARYRFEDGSKWCAMGNTCSSVSEAGFVALRTYVQKPIKLCSISCTSNQSLLSIFLFLTYIKAERNHI